MPPVIAPIMYARSAWDEGGSANNGVKKLCQRFSDTLVKNHYKPVDADGKPFCPHETALPDEQIDATITPVTIIPAHPTWDTWWFADIKQAIRDALDAESGNISVILASDSMCLIPAAEAASEYAADNRVPPVPVVGAKIPTGYTPDPEYTTGVTDNALKLAPERLAKLHSDYDDGSPITTVYVLYNAREPAKYPGPEQQYNAIKTESGVVGCPFINDDPLSALPTTIASNSALLVLPDPLTMVRKGDINKWAKKTAKIPIEAGEGDFFDDDNSTHTHGVDRFDMMEKATGMALTAAQTGDILPVVTDTTVEDH